MNPLGPAERQVVDRLRAIVAAMEEFADENDRFFDPPRDQREEWLEAIEATIRECDSTPHLDSRTNGLVRKAADFMRLSLDRSDNDRGGQPQPRPGEA